VPIRVCVRVLRRLEFVGDSITAGFGTKCGTVLDSRPILHLDGGGVVSGNCTATSDYVERVYWGSSHYYTLPAFLCRWFGADCRVAAVSGRGLLVNRFVLRRGLPPRSEGRPCCMCVYVCVLYVRVRDVCVCMCVCAWRACVLCVLDVARMCAVPA
jgi:hypothetical protein